MTVIRKARSNGTGLRFTIPKFVADTLEIVNGTALEIKLENKKIIIAPVHPSAKMNVQAASAPLKEQPAYESI